MQQTVNASGVALSPPKNRIRPSFPNSGRRLVDSNDMPLGLSLSQDNVPAFLSKGLFKNQGRGDCFVIRVDHAALAVSPTPLKR